MVVIVRAGALGDVLLLRRAVAGLRDRGHDVQLLAPAAGSAIRGPGRSEVSALLAWDGPELAQMLAGASAAGPLARALAGADLVLAYTRSPVVIQALRDRSRRLLVHDPTPPSSGPHASHWLAAPIAAALPDPPDLRFRPEEEAAAERIVAPLPPGFLSLHPGAGSPAKKWALEGFLRVADACANGRPWLLVAGPAEQDLAGARIGRAIVARQLPLRVLGAVLARAGLFVGNDSGVSHLAAACGTPTLALFGPTDPLLWAPVGRHVRCLRPRDGLAALTVEDVLREADVLRRTSRDGVVH